MFLQSPCSAPGWTPIIYKFDNLFQLFYYITSIFFNVLQLEKNNNQFGQLLQKAAKVHSSFSCSLHPHKYEIHRRAVVSYAVLI